MKKLHAALGMSTVMVAIVALGACSSADEDAPVVSETASAITSVCPTRDAIYKPPAWIPACPSGPQIPANWSVAPLFSNQSTAALTRYCRYTWTGPGTGDVTILNQALQVATNSTNKADPDCPVVAPLGGLADLPEVLKPMIDTFQAQASLVPALPQPKAPVRVAVIDSAAFPFSWAEHDTYGHGRTVGRVISELTCSSSGACTTQIVNYLALPQIDANTTNYTEGGFFGTRGQLAQAIVKAVDQWAAEFTASPKKTPPRLILNLSVGWTPEHGGLDPKKLPEPAAAVYDALVHAACYGAINIAAAGNHSGGDSVGPMLPGGWEIVPHPEKCTGPYGKLPTPYPLAPTPGSYAPLVYAASAVDALDRPAATTRPRGQSRLVAYGTNVVTEDTRDPMHTLILSGTSMAAAITSGAAAATWSYRPDLTADQVMKIVYDKAVELTPGEPTSDRSTDFCLGSDCASFALRRVSVCNAARASYFSAGGGWFPKCYSVPAHAGSPPAVPSDLDSIHPMPTTGGVECSPDPGAPDSCGTGGDTALLSPWVDPQPIVGCDACLLILAGHAYFDISNPAYEAVTGMTIMMYDGRQNVLRAERIQSPDGSGRYPEIFRTSVYVPPGVRSAEIHFQVDDGVRPYAVREALPVL